MVTHANLLSLMLWSMISFGKQRARLRCRWSCGCRGRPFSAGSSLLHDQLARPFAALLARPHSSAARMPPQTPPAGEGISDSGHTGVHTWVASPRRRPERRRTERQLKQLPFPPRPLDPDPAFQLEHISGTDGELIR